MSDTSPPSDRDLLLRVDDVCRSFAMGEVEVQVLRNVSFDVASGEFLSIIGPSGSGKTTLLNLLGGLDSPSSGKVLFQDWVLSECTSRELTRYRREKVGFVFQFYNLVPNLTTRENVMVTTDLSDDPLDIDEVLDLVGLRERADHFPAQLSGGEQQRVAIARAVAKNPALLLCDEPTGALDYKTGKRVLRLLVDLNRQLGKTVIVITHNSALAGVADRVIHLRSGQIHEMICNSEPLSPEEVEW